VSIFGAHPRVDLNAVKEPGAPPMTREMPLDGQRPRVTLGIATYNRDTYLREAVESGLRQDFEDLEVLVVLDGSTNPKIDEVLAALQGDPRLRVVHHERNRGIAEAYNTFVSEGRGELIAMLGDDDVCLPGRIRRQVEIFDRLPDTGVVHGDATVIDARGRRTGAWNSREFTPAQLVQSLFRNHNYIVDPTRMVHRRVYDAVGGYDPAYPLANDFDFWLRAARRFRFRHCPGGALVQVRRHGENTSDEAARARELDDVERALEAALEQYELRELIPELDWAVLDPIDAERQALLRLADALEQRGLPVPGLAAKLRGRARSLRPARPAVSSRPPAQPGRKLMMTAYGWNDSGGGTTVPRLAAKELARRGWEVTVFHAAVKPSPSGRPYEVLESDEDGVHLIGIHNRPHGLFDLGNPLRELDDPPITVAFAAALDRSKPDIVHFHNLHNLGASLIGAAAARGLPAYFTTHNYWLICPRAYLLMAAGAICDGPGDGARCAGCAGGADPAAHQRRLAEIRARASTGLTSILAVSDAVRNTLLASGYPAELVDVVRQAMPHEAEIWDRVGRERHPGRLGERLTVAFLGSAYPHKGPQLLIEAAQRIRAELKVRILGEVPERFAAQLRALDRRGVVELEGAFAPSEIAGLLQSADVVVLPSMWWDCAPLAAAEAKAARVPLVVPRLGGLAEAVRDGVDGLVFDALDAADLARQLDRLALEPGLLERLQAAIEPPKAFAAYVDELEAYYAGERPGRVGAARSPERVAVRWQGDHGLATSLSIINTRVSERLTARVQRVKADGVALDAPLAHLADVEVRHQWPPDLRPPTAGRLAAIVPWEFGAVPRDWTAQIERHVDELWVPSEHVRRMYLEGGVAPERLVVVPNGVDLDVFTPDGPRRERPADGLRFLFVGGLIWRKGPDVLLKAWLEAFAGREDVTLAVKDFGADGIYKGGPPRDAIRAHAESGARPRVELISEELSVDDLAALYRSCDVLVHPYRGEGFAMPVLEAMACGLPVIATGGGPTDEFCPPEAGWRIRSRRTAFPAAQLAPFELAGQPWVLEPDHTDLVCLLREAAATDADARRRRGAAGRAAARAFSWDAVAARYDARIQALAARRPLLAGPASPEPFPLSEAVAVRVLATPAWRTEDRLGELLAEWCRATTPATSACLYLLADPDPDRDGDPAALEQRVLAAAAAAQADLERAADINVLMEPLRPERDARLHAAVDLYVPLHPACAGHERLARDAGAAVVGLGEGALAREIATRCAAAERAAA
jgi:glycosyltransferase involved in cell wall biosynthesis